MKNKINRRDIDFSKVDLTKVPLNELDYYARNSSLTQLCTAMCKLLKQMKLIKDEDEKEERYTCLKTVNNSYLEKTKDLPNFNVGKFVDDQKLNAVDKVILNHQLQELEPSRQDLIEKEKEESESSDNSLDLEMVKEK